MAEAVILAIDAGTTGVTALLVDHAGEIRARGYRELTQYYPKPGWVEHDPNEIWNATLSAAGDALSVRADCAPIAMGIASQRETLLFWDRKDGRPLHRAIVWQCRRSEPICQELRSAGLEPDVNRKTGLRLDPYFSGTKALWLSRDDASLPGRIADGTVCFGTVDSWLAWQLTGGAAHVTDVTNASRTLCFDIERQSWDDELLTLFGLNRSVMPQVRQSGARHADTTACGGIPPGLPIAALVGDQQAAAYGPGMFRTRHDEGNLRHRLLHSGLNRGPEAEGMRWRVQFSSPGLRFSGVGTTSESSPMLRRQNGWHRVCRMLLGWSLCRLSPGWVRRIGVRRYVALFTA